MKELRRGSLLFLFVATDILCTTIILISIIYHTIPIIYIIITIITIIIIIINIFVAAVTDITRATKQNPLLLLSLNLS